MVTSIPLTITQYMASPEQYESRRITLAVANPFNFTSAQWPAATASANLTIWNGQDTTIMRIDSDTEIDGSPYPTWPVRLTGVATQFTTATTNDTTGYQITPMFISDFVAINAPPVTNFRLLSPTNGSSIIVDSAANYDFRWRKTIDFNGEAIAYQFKPVLFAGLASNNGGADSVRTVSGAQLLTYLGTNESLELKWTVLALSAGNPAVGSIDTLSVTLFRRSTPPAAGWTAQTSGLSTYLYSVKAVGPGVAWAAGAGGKVLRTTNGGTTWSQVGNGNIGTSDIYNVEAISSNTAFVTTSPAATYIFRTTNGGTSWDTVFTQAGGFINAIKMFDATNGIAEGDPVGGKWTLARTTNGGTSWARIATEPAQVGGEAGTQNGISAIGSNYIWFNSGVGGRIYRTTNGGTTWTSGTAPAGVTATSNVWFINPQYGIATSSGSNAVFRSTDGGATWTSVTVAGTGFLIACGGAGNNDFWYARGTTVYRSTNRGATFASAYVGTGTYVGLSFVAYAPNTSGWAVTSTGGIAGFSGTVTGIGEPQVNAIPETFELSQNFPNPFNPTTTIRFSVPKESFVSLKVYNILGQEVVTIAEEFKSVGTFNAVWNGRNSAGNQVASGMYLYRIEAKPADGSQPFTALKKMVLLK